MIEFRVLGVPAPQGSKTRMPNGAILDGKGKTGRMTPTPLADAIARCITRHLIGSTEPVRPPAWITAAATEIVDAMHCAGWNPCPPDMTPDLIIPASTLLIELLAREADT